MALEKAILKTGIKALLNDLKDDLNQVDAIEKYAEKLSIVIDNYVKSANVIGTDSQDGSITGFLE